MTFQPNYTIKELLDASIHFGHKKNLWNPKMKKYIHGVRDNVHIIDLQKTAFNLYKILRIVFEISCNNGRILFLNTKKQSSDITKENAIRCKQYYINHRWLGGTLTNWSTISSSIKTLTYYERLLNQKNITYTKKELLDFERKKQKLETAMGGIKNLTTLPDILFVVDVKVHSLAIREAQKLGIKIIGVVDTNSSPDGIDYIIPGNDDSRKSVSFYSMQIANAIIAGVQFSKDKNVSNKDIVKE